MFLSGKNGTHSISSEHNLFKSQLRIDLAGVCNGNENIVYITEQWRTGKCYSNFSNSYP